MRFHRAAITAILLVAGMVAAGCSGSGDDRAVSSTTSTTTSSSTTTPTTTSSSTTSTSTTTSSSSTTTHRKKRRTDPLTGRKLSKNPVIAAKIDNTSFPQFGVADADIIYTEQVEGGLTRLIAIFHSTLPTEIGAVRSMRSTDMELLPSYGKILLVNSGGAGPNLRRMRDSILVNVTEGSTGIWRSNARRAPYNLHANLQTIAQAHQGQAKAQRVGFTFAKKDERLADAKKVTDIDVTMIGARTTFTYAKGKYWPSHNGTRYVDDDGAKVSVDNVIVQHVTDKPDGIIDPAGNPSFLTSTVGSGKFTLYRNGRAVDGTWSRDTKTDPTIFTDSHGKRVPLHPGRTWVLLAPQTSTFHRG